MVNVETMGGAKGMLPVSKGIASSLFFRFHDHRSFAFIGTDSAADYFQNQKILLP
jgi:hypothetical protein